MMDASQVMNPKITFSKTTLEDILARYSVKAEGSASTTNKTPASVKTALSTLRQAYARVHGDKSDDSGDLTWLTMANLKKPSKFASRRSTWISRNVMRKRSTPSARQNSHGHSLKTSSKMPSLKSRPGPSPPNDRRWWTASTPPVSTSARHVLGEIDVSQWSPPNRTPTAKHHEANQARMQGLASAAKTPNAAE